MPRVGSGRRMTSGALKDRIIRRVGVACSANAVGVAVIHWEECVIARGQCCGNPRGCGVACGAGGWPSCGDVIGIGGSGEVSLVA